MLKSGRVLFALIGMGLLSTACVRIQTDPIRIEPIYIEVTINHRVQQELDSLFAEIDKASETMNYAPLEPTPSDP